MMDDPLVPPDPNQGPHLICAKLEEWSQSGEKKR